MGYWDPWDPKQNSGKITKMNGKARVLWSRFLELVHPRLQSDRNERVRLEVEIAFLDKFLAGATVGAVMDSDELSKNVAEIRLPEGEEVLVAVKRQLKSKMERKAELVKAISHDSAYRHHKNVHVRKLLSSEGLGHLLDTRHPVATPLYNVNQAPPLPGRPVEPLEIAAFLLEQQQQGLVPDVELNAAANANANANLAENAGDAAEAGAVAMDVDVVVPTPEELRNCRAVGIMQLPHASVRFSNVGRLFMQLAEEYIKAYNFHKAREIVLASFDPYLVSQDGNA
ncbi:hypothetical protein HDV05_004735 [Chytridiales sp. JEL 0842]|nr:hypothetical protein HDV05_004735 [Chytridiales sp. JEL 0842]